MIFNIFLNVINDFNLSQVVNNMRNPHESMIWRLPRLR